MVGGFVQGDPNQRARLDIRRLDRLGGIPYEYENAT
jgi:hypothetical protein